MSAIYESDKLLAEYLLFHYGRPEDIFTGAWGGEVKGSLDFPVRCAGACVEDGSPTGQARALDIGCAVGRSTFELARHCDKVIGIDYSHRFIGAASELKSTGEHPFDRLEEGVRVASCVARVPSGILRERASFEQGDAMDLRPDLDSFDIVLAANLLCRLPDPARFLARLPSLVKPGGRLVITTPCTWLEEFTPREKWLGGEDSSTLDGLRRRLAGDFSLLRTRDMPFVIREHARKFQWTVAQCSVWTRIA